jgi:iron complex outermembrane receptor protein
MIKKNTAIHRAATCSVATTALVVALVAGPAQAQSNAVADTAATPSDTAPAASASSGEEAGQLGEIIVTANKRSQSINTVPITITSASGDKLTERGITSTADLAKIVPGLTAQQTQNNTPVYTLRGVGFYDTTLSASPTVAVYTDEVPLPFSVMTKAASLDVERVEVLKGPQGTLFGNNTTGGAINFVAAKPTDSFAAGADLSYGRFNEITAQGYLSGPVTDTLKLRLSSKIVNSGAWQKSFTRDDEIGATRLYMARLLGIWEPSAALTVSFNVNGWIDKSDSQAAQRVFSYISSPGNINEAPVRDYPYPAAKARSADWGYSFNHDLDHDDYLVQGSLRLDYKLSDAITFTSVSALERFKTDAYSDLDGTALPIIDQHTNGHINTFSQELRVTANLPGANLVGGVNYENDRTLDNHIQNYGAATTARAVGDTHQLQAADFTRQDMKTYAVFGNAEVEVAPKLSVQGGVRYTKYTRKFSGCTYDTEGSGLKEGFNLLERLLRDPALPFVPINTGDCVDFGPTYEPAITPTQAELSEDNVSFRAGVNYKTDNRGLIYATVSKGYKGGSFPTTSTALTSQYAPVRQENVLVYEAGFKQPLFDRRLQLDAAAFYYKYNDKQLQGRVLDPIFGPLSVLVQIPRSRIWGIEGHVAAQPINGLNLDVAATYLSSKIQEFVGYNNAGVIADFRGSRFPYTPKWQVVADGQYDRRLNDKLSGYVGGSLTYNSSTSAAFGNVPQLGVDAYTVIDVRAGIKAASGRWDVQLWGRNITNAYYWMNAYQIQDVYARYAAKPVTYGATVRLRIF